MDRRKWQAWIHENDGWIDEELYLIIKSSARDCSIDCNVETIDYKEDNQYWFKIKGLRQYNYISFGIDDEMKISAFQSSFFHNLTWNYWCNPEETTMEEMTALFNRQWNCAPTSMMRSEKGLFVKIGKIVTAIGMDGSNSCLCATIAEKVRLRAQVDLSCLQVSDKPSEIYALDHCPNGNIGSSCMRNMNKDRFQIYNDIGCKILYLTENNHLIGRALLHDRVYQGDRSFKFMDRVYFDCERTKAIFYSWAKENDYVRKFNQSMGCDDYMRPDGNKFTDKTLCIDVDDNLRDRYEEVPYIDTFAYYHENNEQLCVRWIDGVVTSMKETDGNDSKSIITDSDRSICSCCNNRDNTGRWHDDYYYCEECFYERYTYCENCGEYEYADDTYFVGDYSVCRTCYNDHYFCCDDCNKYHHRDNGLHLNNSVICHSCYENGDYFTCDHCDGIFNIDESNELQNGNHICDDCFSSECSECQDCNSINYTGDMIESEIGIICADCLTDNFKQYHCGEIVCEERVRCDCGFIFECEVA